MPCKDKNFYGHLTHASLQKQEDSVKTIGDGFDDAYIPKAPITDKFYDNVHRNK